MSTATAVPVALTTRHGTTNDRVTTARQLGFQPGWWPHQLTFSNMLLTGPIPVVRGDRVYAMKYLPVDPNNPNVLWIRP